MVIRYHFHTYLMKTVLGITTIIPFLVVFGMMSNNDSVNWNVFAQINPENPPSINGTSITSPKVSEEMKINWTGSIDVESTIVDAFKSKIKVDIIEAIKAAQGSIGLNSTVKEAELTHVHNYLVYKITVVDEDMKKYEVIVDPGNGQVLVKKEITLYDEHNMKYCEAKDDKYS